MPTRLTPIVDGQLYFFPTWDVLTKEELQQYDRDFYAVIEASPYPLVHSIYDYSELKGLPPLKDLTNLKVGHHPRAGWTIFTGAKNVLFKFLVSTTVQFFKQRIRFADTNAEALAFLQSVDSTLPDLSGVDLDAIAAQVFAESRAP
jgi:hypothetical protein